MIKRRVVNGEIGRATWADRGLPERLSLLCDPLLRHRTNWPRGKRRIKRIIVPRIPRHVLVRPPSLRHREP